MKNQLINKNLLLIAFTLSGMSALIYEIVWSRPLQLIFGSTIYAVSTILTTFFVGFALGSYFFRNIADRTKNPILIFAMLEFGIGLYGLVILQIFNILPKFYLALDINGLQFVQFFILFLVLIIPATLFGATWPVVNKAYIGGGNVGKDAGKLYSFNSFGSAFGPLAAGFILIPLLGIKITSISVALLNLIIAVTLFAYSKECYLKGASEK